jgi:type VI secretion system secreted protein Hcp
MKKAKQTAPIVFVTILITAVVIFALRAPAGSLEPTSAPGPTMHTLDEIYANTLNSSTSSTGVIVPPEGAATERGKSYLWIDEVRGESTDDERRDWIDIFGYEYVMTQTYTDPSGGGGSAGRVSFDAITIIKQVDKTSPQLSLHCCTGRHLNRVYIESTLLTADRIPGVYYRIELEDVVVAGVAPRLVHVGGEYVLMEEVSLRFGKIKWIYSEYDPKGGVQEFEQGWDLEANQPR